MHFKEKLLTLRKQRGMTQQELSDKLNVSRQAISSWERGTTDPSTENLVSIGKLFGVSVDDLVNEDTQLQVDVTAHVPVAEDDTAWIKRKYSVVKNAGIVFLAVGALVAVIAVTIIVYSAIVRESENNLIRLDEIKPEYINPSEVISWPDAWTIIEE